MGKGSGYTTNSAAGITSISGGSGWANLTEDQTAGTAGAWKATASSSPSVVDWAIQLVALAPASATASPDINGNYSFTNLLNGTYTVTPSDPGLSFTPLNQSVTINGASVSNINFNLN
jgi:hypothetical protein